ncbi:hypothetical protein SteCoe_20060 [Stentor coeruleus]|uniref:CUE domain-containing protein n=1 Tax=Stentor coeruleus TaxID=5963 RepID=A0A1R2BSL5_9CILI|nr:hypothetical protein SteCoe_20060 [Stentor coeruleus]
METKSQKLADLAGMFDDVDLEVIENILDMCKGKVNKTAEVLLKMKDDASVKPEDSKPTKKEPILNENFLELDESQPEYKVQDESTRKEIEAALAENDRIEENYMAQMQKAIAMSIEENKHKSKQEQSQNKKKFKEKLKDFFHKKDKKQDPDEKNSPKNAESLRKNNIPECLPITCNPDEEVFQFVFNKKLFTRGEIISHN